MMEGFANIVLRAMFVENLALAFLLGMCTYLAVSRRVTTAFGLGIAVVAVQSITVPLNNAIYHGLLAPGALSWLGFGGSWSVTGSSPMRRSTFRSACRIAPAARPRRPCGSSHETWPRLSRAESCSTPSSRERSGGSNALSSTPAPKRPARSCASPGESRLAWGSC